MAQRWEMYAHDYGDKFMHIGEYHYVKLHLLSKPIVEVDVVESPEGQYWGWLETGGDAPRMIWPSKVAFEVCFPYGPKAEEERGKGRIVRLTITAKEGDTSASTAPA